MCSSKGRPHGTPLHSKPGWASAAWDLPFVWFMLASSGCTIRDWRRSVKRRGMRQSITRQNTAMFTETYVRETLMELDLALVSIILTEFWTNHIIHSMPSPSYMQRWKYIHRPLRRLNGYSNAPACPAEQGGERAPEGLSVYLYKWPQFNCPLFSWLLIPVHHVFGSPAQSLQKLSCTSSLSTPPLGYLYLHHSTSPLPTAGDSITGRPT